ncbi:hypothetical protein K440DRAFT_682722, partial [Wilcoxina mikolae CBS 423.85]
MEDITAIRVRLISHTAMLTAFNTTISSTSQARLEQKLDKFMAGVRAGMRQGSVISVDTVDSLPTDERELWHELRRELEDIGISAVVLTEKKEFIVDWFKKAIAEGALEEICVVPEEDDDITKTPSSRLSSQMNSS